MTQIPDNLRHVGPGWHGILVELHGGLVKLDPGYTVSQVKEKFGGLRVYLDFSVADSDGAMQDLINAAVTKADVTCEECGQPGSLREGSWLLTLCDECQKLRLQSKRTGDWA